MIKCLIFPGTANHTGMMMPLSLGGTLAEKPHSYPWFIFPFISIDHSDCKNHSFIKAGLAAFVLVQMKFTKRTFVTRSLGVSAPKPRLYNVGIMWQGWIFWVTAVWLAVLTRIKAVEESSQLFIFLWSLLNFSVFFCFICLTWKLCFSTPENATSSFVRSNKQATISFHHGEIKVFTLGEGSTAWCGKLGARYLFPSTLADFPHLKESNFSEIPLMILFSSRGNESSSRLVIHAGCLSKWEEFKMQTVQRANWYHRGDRDQRAPLLTEKSCSLFVCHRVNGHKATVMSSKWWSLAGASSAPFIWSFADVGCAWMLFD